MHHCADCISRSERLAAKQNAYKKQWPNHCQHCGGTGGYSSPGCSVPYGSTWVSLPDDYDPCPKCWEEGICPRCGEEMIPHEQVEEGWEIPEVCPHCQWQEGDDGLYEEDECPCIYVLGGGLPLKDLEAVWQEAEERLKDFQWAVSGHAPWNEVPARYRYAAAIDRALRSVPSSSIVFE